MESSTENVLMLKSTPMVVKVSQWKLLSTYLFISDVLPQVYNTQASLILAGKLSPHRVSNDDNLEDIIKSGVGSIHFILGLLIILPEAQPRQFSLVVLQPVFLCLEPLLVHHKTVCWPSESGCCPALGLFLASLSSSTVFQCKLIP